MSGASKAKHEKIPPNFGRLNPLDEKKEERRMKPKINFFAKMTLLVTFQRACF